MQTKGITRCMILLALLMTYGLFSIGVASAQSPPACNANCLSVTIGRSIAVAVPGQTVDFTVAVTNSLTCPAGNGCDVDQTTVTFRCPDAAGNPEPTTAPVTLASNASFPADGTGNIVFPPQSCIMPTPDPGVTFVFGFSRAGDQDGPVTDLTQGRLLSSPTGSPFRRDNAIDVTLQTCDVLVDKQISCDGGMTWADDNGLMSSDEDGANDCTALVDTPIMVRYRAQNTGSADLVSCVLDDDNNTFGAVLDPGGELVLIAPTVITPYLSGELMPLCMDADVYEPDRADIICTCGVPDSGITVTAFDRADLICESCPELTTQSSVTGTVLPGTPVYDTAILTGGTVTGGDVDFYLCGPEYANPANPSLGCPTGGSLISANVPVTGGQASSGTESPMTPGLYCWRAEWSGADLCPGQDFTNNTDECWEVQCTPECTVEKSVNPTTSKATDTVAYDLGPICNTGTCVLELVSCHDTVLDPQLDGNCDDEITGCFPLDPGECCAGSGVPFATNIPYTIQASDPDPLVNTITVQCSGGGQNTSCSDSAQVDLQHPACSITKTCDPEHVTLAPGQSYPLNYTVEVCNDSPVSDTITMDITVSDTQAGISDQVTLGPGACQPYTQTQTISADQCPDDFTNTATATWDITDDVLPNFGECDNSPASDTCSCDVEVVGACRMTGGHVNTAGDVDVGWSAETGTKYTTGGQIGAPNETGCCYDPSDITQRGRNSNCPWGDWEHNHHSGPDDGNISGGSFAFHSGTAAAPPEAMISNITCADPGWCVQARPAPNKQIYWEGTGVFHNLKGKKGEMLPMPNFPGCPSVQVWDKKVPGSLHYYKAHVGDFGEPAGQRQKPVDAYCASIGETVLDDWGIAGCNAIVGVTEIDAIDNGDKTALHPLCLAQDCAECPDWYDIEIYCTADPDDPENHVIYRVAHYILEGNFQIHPPVGDSCNYRCDGVCEVGVLPGLVEMCNPDCTYLDCCGPM